MDLSRKGYGPDEGDTGDCSIGLLDGLASL